MASKESIEAKKAAEEFHRAVIVPPLAFLFFAFLFSSIHGAFVGTGIAMGLTAWILGFILTAHRNTQLGYAYLFISYAITLIAFAWIK